jgi:sulfite reductase (NADPH) flavoprotein alpha-component
MLTQPKLKQLQDLVASSSNEELIWMNGYLAGLLANHTDHKTSEVATAPDVPAKKITIAYGTETGNSKKLASDFAAKAKKSGHRVKLQSLDQYKLNDLPKEEYFFAVVSTQGDGEPPATAKKFYDHIHQNGFQLQKLKYGVLALGDTAYPLFCKAGEDIDAQLNKLGGERIVSLQKCDTDYESYADGWFNEVLQQLQNTNGQAPAAAPPALAKKPAGKKTIEGRVTANINLNDRTSHKETHHIEIAAEELVYQPGDSLGIVPENPVAVVETILSVAGVDRTQTFLYRNEELTAFDLLKKKLNVSLLSPRVVNKYAALISQEIPETAIGLSDLLKIYPLTGSVQFGEVINILEPITPRLYSISSSPEAHEGEVHITVARDKFLVNEEVKFGLCSDALSQWAGDSSIHFYIHKNDQFRLPADDKDVIMIGPGTGIAPFRSFLAHRDATGAEGRNWLFFGDQHFQSDFLYQSEIQSWLSTGVLTKVNTAFSRDQKEKVYVQHKMQKHAKELFGWLEEGAHVYVCGAKEPMSVDVENTLLQIIAQEGGLTKEAAEEYVSRLKEEGRYLKDVY